MVFGQYKHAGNLNVEINGYKLEQVAVTKFLGVLIDERLN